MARLEDVRSSCLSICLSFAVSAGVIAFAIFPRRDRFVAPGPQLDRNEQLELFQVIEDVARTAGEPMPAAIYLIPELNAYVSERGGFLGFGTRRIMGLGLPLLQSLNVEELRAIVAHEFGHYSAGDTRFSCWIYTARAAIIRSVAMLHSVNSVARLPFQWYAQLFLKLTLRVARRQEFAADALAARIVGVTAMSSALRACHSNLFHAFWSQELLPVLQCGFLPPVSSGFETFRRERSDEAEVLEDDSTGPYDTHPPTTVRLQALSMLPPMNPRKATSGMHRLW
jgi:Zn-dependent protease with chaperone function